MGKVVVGNSSLNHTKIEASPSKIVVQVEKEFVPVEIIVYVDRPVEVIVEKYIETIVEKQVDVIIEKPIEIVVVKEVPIEVVVEKIVLVDKIITQEVPVEVIVEKIITKEDTNKIDKLNKEVLILKAVIAIAIVGGVICLIL